MATDNTHDKERYSRADFATHWSEAAFQTRLDPMYDWWERFNREHFGARLKPPHIDIGRTAPRSLGECAPTTGYGARIAVVIYEGLAFGTNRDLVTSPWPPAPGTGRMIEDLLLRFTTRQSVLEEQDAEERGYDGFPPGRSSSRPGGCSGTTAACGRWRRRSGSGARSTTCRSWRTPSRTRDAGILGSCGTCGSRWNTPAAAGCSVVSWAVRKRPEADTN